MKKLFTLFVAVAFALSLASFAVAAEKPADAAKPAAAPAKAAEPAKKEAPKAEAKKEAPKKAKAKVITGTIEALDAKAGTFSVKGKKETFALKAGEKVKLDGFKAGDKVTVTFSEGTASKLVAAKKAAPKAEAKKEAPKAEAKPAAAPAKPAEPAKPAAAPAKPAEKK